MNKKIIFLDVDGVLTNEITKFQEIDPRCMAELNHIIEVTGASIVLSTSRRHDDDIEKFLNDAGLEGEIIGRTPSLSHFSNGIWHSQERGDEIQSWIDSHKFTGDFIIIDDDSDMNHLAHKLIMTNPYFGLTKDGGDEAITILSRFNADVVIAQMDELLQTLRKNKPNNRSDEDRYWAMTISDAEHMRAMFYTYVNPK